MPWNQRLKEYPLLPLEDSTPQDLMKNRIRRMWAGAIDPGELSRDWQLIDRYDKYMAYRSENSHGCATLDVALIKEPDLPFEPRQRMLASIKFPDSMSLRMKAKLFIKSQNPGPQKGKEK